NDVSIKVEEYEERNVTVNGKERKKINVRFLVKSEEYHSITTLLYEQTFTVKVPEKDLSFRGTITQYSTSITNLYEENQVGEFKLELTEVN
ncbi:MAG TPA: DUF3219 family protein, partial [Chondromyces sp.]|nr:DUF3219 family protein [Chondromyces sp.]